LPGNGGNYGGGSGSRSGFGTGGSGLIVIAYFEDVSFNVTGVSSATELGSVETAIDRFVDVTGVESKTELSSLNTDALWSVPPDGGASWSDDAPSVNVWQNVSLQSNTWSQ
jgi:hypothetical protein